jgi:hypothetical protein
MMRRWFGLVLATVLLVSHGGFAGVLSHGDDRHNHSWHDHGEASVSDADADAAVVPESDTQADLAHHAGSHSHNPLALAEAAALTESFEEPDTLPRPGGAAALFGSEERPPIHPPSA